MNRLFFVIALTMIVFQSPTTSQAGPMFANGGFEMDQWTDQFSVTPNGWSAPAVLTTDYPYGLVNGNPSGLGPTPYGTRFVILGNSGSYLLGQEVEGFTIGNSYTLTFAMSARLPDGAHGGPLGAFMVMGLTGASVTTANFAEHMTVDANSYSQWHDHSLTFTATSNNVLFQMKGDASHPGGSWEFGLDNFSLTENTVATPEPATLTLFGLGVLGMCAYRWRRQNHTQR